jgi:hypothetical protein
MNSATRHGRDKSIIALFRPTGCSRSDLSSSSVVKRANISPTLRAVSTAVKMIHHVSPTRRQLTPDPQLREIAETDGTECVAVNPHLFRDCAVFAVATVAGDRMGIASGLLQHTDPRTTEKYYNKGASLVAVRQYQRILDKLISD